MAATVTASIASLILTLDDPGRDDLDSVIVWGSTTNGFTPGAGNIVYKGKSLTVTIANLTPLVTYYLRYAYVSTIDTSDYVISSQVSGTPSKIDGSVIVDNLRGKQLVGNNVYDRGTVITAYLATPATPVTTATLNVVDTTDFPTSGTLLILSNVSGTYRLARYTGKSATTLTGVSGLIAPVYSGEVVMPLFYATGSAASYMGTGPLSADGYSFPQSGGNAIAFGSGITAAAFTYTAGQNFMGGIYTPALTGVSGLGSQASLFYYLSNPGFPTATLSSGASPSTITLSSSTSYFEANGGLALAVKIGATGYFEFEYRSVSGTTMTLASGAFTAPSAGTWTIIPIQSNVVVGAMKSVFSYDNKPTGLRNYSLSPAASDLNALSLTPTATDPALSIVVSGSDLPVKCDQPSIFSLADLTNSSIQGSFGFVYYQPKNEAFLAYGADTTSFRYVQPMSATHFFSNEMGSGYDSISFSDATNTYSFNADGGSANATIALFQIELGNASDTTIARSAAGVIAVEGGVVPKENRANTFSVNQTVSVTDNTNAALRVNQSGTAMGLVVESGNVAIGAASTSYKFELVSLGSAVVSGIRTQVNNANASYLRFDKARGGSGTASAVLNGDTLGAIRFHGYDGASYIEAARIEADVDAAPGTNDMPGSLLFQTKADGATTLPTRLLIDNAGNILSVSTGGLGYGTGSGGSVTQATNRTTGVTLNKTNGAITLVSAAGSTSWQSFTVTNSTVSATDTVIVNQKSGTDLYECHVTAVSAGSFRISYRTTAGTTTEQPVFNFSVIKAVTA